VKNFFLILSACCSCHVLPSLKTK